MKYPAGFWNYNSLGEGNFDYIKDWEDLGFTVPMSPLYDPDQDDIRAMYRILDAAHEKGMKVIVNDKRSYWSVLTEKGEGAYREGFQEILRDFGDHPAVFGFHVGDEPNKEQFDDACLAQSIQEEMSPKHYSFLNLLPWHYGIEDRIGYVDFGKYLDDYCAKSKTKFICYDCYSQMNPGETGFDMYFYNLKKYWQASLKNDAPFWTTLLGIGHFNYRIPSYDDVRWQISTAATHGAKGILWFYIYLNTPGFSNYRQASVNEHGRRTDVFYHIADNMKSFLNVFGDTLMRLNLDHVWHYGRCYGGFPMYVPDEETKMLTSTNNCPLILSYFTSDKNEDFIMLVNNSTTTNTYAKLSLRGRKKIYMCYPGNEINEIRLTQDSPHLEYTDDLTILGHWLSPGQAILFKYEDKDDSVIG